MATRRPVQRESVAARHSGQQTPPRRIRSRRSHADVTPADQWDNPQGVAPIRRITETRQAYPLAPITQRRAR